jgi:hypothetical protein
VNIENLTLEPEESVLIEQLLSEVLKGHSSVSVTEFLVQAHVVAQELPRRIRTQLYRFKLTERAAALCIKNNYVSEDLPPTPTHIPATSENWNREEILHVLYCSLVGEPFAWSSIQNGNLMNEVIPIAEHADRPMSSGSSYLFDLHTEDAFHPLMGDYLGLFCLRNQQRTPTLIACIDDTRLSEASKCILFGPRFIVGANVAHDVPNADRRMPILFGAKTHPYLRINTNVDPDLSQDPDAMKAYQELIDQLRAHIVEIVLEPGDCFIMDNLRAAHGRPAYQPAFLGSDRWLKRLYVTADLRKSRHLRTAPEARIINSQGQSTYD